MKLRITALIAGALAALALAFAGGGTWAAHQPHATYCATEDSCAYAYHDHQGTIVPVTP